VLVGNVPTEKVLEALRQRNVTLPIKRPLEELTRLSAEIGERFGGPKM
jgi:hypothetical protein